MANLTKTMATTCFVCDEEVVDGVFITLAETFVTKTAILNKISELVGGDFLVIAREEDQLCRRCASLLNESDKLEVDLLEIHNTIKGFLDLKYNLAPKEDNCSESDVAALECSKDQNESGDILLKEFPSVSFDDDENVPTLQSKNIGQLSELKKKTQINNVNSSPLFSNVEVNVDNKQSTQNEELRREVKQERFCDEEDRKQSIQQYSVHNEEVREVKQETICAEHFNTSLNVGDSDHGILDKTGCNDKVSVNEENHVYLPNEKIDRIQGKISLTRNLVTDEKCIKIKTEKDSHSHQETKRRPILPKIVKSEDLLKLASMCIFEPIDPNNIIKINKFENDGSVQQYVEIRSSSLDNHNVHNAVSNRNNSTSNRKRTKHGSQSCESYKCDICGKGCSTQNRLDMHKTIHEKKVCDFCGRTFNNNYRLKVHRNIHTKQKMFACSICGKTFIHHSTYWYHRKWHDEPFPFSCEFCGRPFKHSSMLAIHRRKHTGERPYKCSYCPLTFTISTTLKNHEVLHTQEYAFKCNVCLKGFTIRSKFVNHMAKKHNNPNEDGSKPKKRERRATTKPGKKQKSQPNSRPIDNCQPVILENLEQYLPLELGDGVEVVVGTEQVQMRKYNDISVEIIKKDNSELIGEWVVSETVDTNHNFPFELNEGVEVVLEPEEIVLGHEEFVLGREEIVLGSEGIVLSEDIIIRDNLISQMSS